MDKVKVSRTVENLYWDAWIHAMNMEATSQDGFDNFVSDMEQMVGDYLQQTVNWRFYKMRPVKET